MLTQQLPLATTLSVLSWWSLMYNKLSMVSYGGLWCVVVSLGELWPEVFLGFSWGYLWGYPGVILGLI